MVRRLMGLSLLALLTGCGTAKLETGYQPKKLGESHVVRRSYYASPFTPEARAADLEREQEFDARRPSPGY